MKILNTGFCIVLLLFSCTKNGGSDLVIQPQQVVTFSNTSVQVNGTNNGSAVYKYIPVTSVVKLFFSTAINKSTAAANILFNEASGVAVPLTLSYENNESSIVVTSVAALKSFTSYNLVLSQGLQSNSGKNLSSTTNVSLTTGIDSTDKFPLVDTAVLLNLVQRQTFKYFWEFGHPASGMARERNTSGDLVTTGGTGFGVMAIVTAIYRNFITRAEGLARIKKITGFLTNTAQTFHGVFPHWLNGSTGVVIPFSSKDDGADLVETSLLMQGLLTARQYFNGTDADEVSLRNEINTLYNKVEWSWFRKNNENILYWHWSKNFSWDINLPVKGWNETLITYAMAASSTSFTIPKVVYDEGFAGNGSMKNNNLYYGIQLPLGPQLGGPLFFSQYSFLGINPKGLTDQYADYEKQVINHTKINYEYCKANPNNYYGYSNKVWGITASDIPNGYTASSPTNDVGVIAPTAAISSMPYTPVESMAALQFFYYKLGDKIFKEYGFVDAFKLSDPWFANSFLAIDQGPQIVMIENYRSGLLWKLFMSCPEIKTGMKKLGFQSPFL